MSIAMWNKINERMEKLEARIRQLELESVKQPIPAEAVTELQPRRGRPPKQNGEVHGNT
jgi:hypothetical protein